MSHLNKSTTPTGDSLAQRAAMQPAFTQDLFDEVLTSANLKRAWQQVRANKGAAGVDGVGIDDFPDWAKQHWPQCVTQLQQGRYQPQPVKRVRIEKPDGGKRLLGIPTVVDRVIQQAITQVLSPIIDPTFSTYSFGSDPIAVRIRRFIKYKGTSNRNGVLPWMLIYPNALIAFTTTY